MWVIDFKEPQFRVEKRTRGKYPVTPGKWEHELQSAANAQEEVVRSGQGDGQGFIVEVALSGWVLTG